MAGVDDEDVAVAAVGLCLGGVVAGVVVVVGVVVVPSSACQPLLEPC